MQTISGNGSDGGGAFIEGLKLNIKGIDMRYRVDYFFIRQGQEVQEYELFEKLADAKNFYADCPKAMLRDLNSKKPFVMKK